MECSLYVIKDSLFRIGNHSISQLNHDTVPNYSVKKNRTEFESGNRTRKTRNETETNIN